MLMGLRRNSADEIVLCHRAEYCGGLRERRTQTAPSCPVMANEAKGVAILNSGVFARDPLIDGHEDFFLAEQLQEMPKIVPLSLNHLPHGHGVGNFAGQVPLSIGRL